MDRLEQVPAFERPPATIRSKRFLECNGLEAPYVGLTWIEFAVSAARYIGCRQVQVPGAGGNLLLSLIHI